MLGDNCSIRTLDGLDGPAFLLQPNFEPISGQQAGWDIMDVEVLVADVAPPGPITPRPAGDDAASPVVAHTSSASLIQELKLMGEKLQAATFHGVAKT